MRFGDDESHDLAQDTFRRFYEHVDDLRNEAAWSFLHSVARNVAFNAIRSSKTLKRTPLLESVESLEILPDTDEVKANLFTGEPPVSPEAAFIDDESARIQRKQLDAAIHDLPIGAQQCLLLWMDGNSYEQIARTLGITIDAVKSRLRDARRAVREQLDGPPNSQ